MQQVIFLSAVILSLAGCTMPAVIGVLEQDKVVVEWRSNTPVESINEQAKSGCDIYGRIPVHVSYRCLKSDSLSGGCLRGQTVFACVEP